MNEKITAHNIERAKAAQKALREGKQVFVKHELWPSDLVRKIVIRRAPENWIRVKVAGEHKWQSYKKDAENWKFIIEDKVS